MQDILPMYTRVLTLIWYESSSGKFSKYLTNVH